MISDKDLISFKIIVKFINDLALMYGTKLRPLKLYRRLINKTELDHIDAISKNIEAFRSFCLANREQILTKSKSLVCSRITYSNRVYIDMTDVFGLVDSENLNVIWEYLLTISASVDPEGRAKDVLKKGIPSEGGETNETKLLSDIINKVGSTPGLESGGMMGAFSAITNSGVLSDLTSTMIGGLSSGNLDFGNLLGAVQKMVTDMDPQGDDAAANMLGSLTSVLNNNGNGGPPNMGAMMQTLMTSFSGMNTGTVVSEISDEKTS